MLAKLNEDVSATSASAWTSYSCNEDRNSYVDAWLYNDAQELEIQVTRPDFNDCWLKVGLGQTVQSAINAERAAKELHRVIQKKQSALGTWGTSGLSEITKRRMQLQNRRYNLEGLVLAIDCIETPVLVLEPALTFFMETYGKWVRNTSFSAVWAVGPTTDLTYKLK